MWSLVVGGVDVSATLRAGARFTEVASSSTGSATFALGGPQPAAVAGALVTLTRSSSELWAGLITSAVQQRDSAGNVIATLVTAAPLAAQFALVAQYAVTTPVDVASVATALVALASYPITFPGAPVGVSAGSLVFHSIDSGLTVLATLAGLSWRVQNGALEFVGPDAGIASIPTVLAQTATICAAVAVGGGLDALTGQPLRAVYASPTVATGPVFQAVFAEIAGRDTLDQMGNVLVGRYGAGAFTAIASLPAGTQVRAGDAVSDQSGAIGLVTRVIYTLTGGDF